jgi:hypothetical protein
MPRKWGKVTMSFFLYLYDIVWGNSVPNNIVWGD